MGFTVLNEPLQGQLAAVDLGSNSFHMVIARVVEDQVQILDRIREPVRLAAGLRPDGRLDEVSQSRALDCLERFGQRIRGFPRRQVRAVGTNTLRQAHGPDDFLGHARDRLGHPIDILPGREEARLIYLGVCRTSVQHGKRQLVVDIGGGSTEIIVGEGEQPIEVDSLYMGCVGYSRRFFSSGNWTGEEFQAAQVAAALEMQGVEQRYRQLGWENCMGSSGTIKAVGEILRVNAWSASGIDTLGLKRLVRAVIDAGGVRNLLKLKGVEEERVAVLPGGVAILSTIFDRLGVERMEVAQGALREGLLHDLYGRAHEQDVREQTIAHLCTRYSVDTKQAARVQHTASRLLEQLVEKWSLEREHSSRMLRWASLLHEIGLSICYAGYHKHGAYLVANSDMPGFSREDRAFLATLIRGHRRKISSCYFPMLRPSDRQSALPLCVILRLAVLLNRSRRPEQLPQVKAHLHKNRLRLHFSRGWLKAHALTRADLESEAEYLSSFDLDLQFSAKSSTHRKLLPSGKSK